MSRPTTLKGWALWHWGQLWTWRSLTDLVILIAVSWIGTAYHVPLWILIATFLLLSFLVSIGLLIFEQTHGKQ